MPAAYAHYRFGTQALELLDPALRQQISRFRQVYDMGVQGPDFFFYYNPLFHTAAGSLGHKFHMQSGKTFFSAAVRRLRLNPSEVGTVYLYGVLAHYCLDSVVHPFIHETEAAGEVSHVAMESEFERFLLTKDGKIPAHAQDLSRFTKLSRGECVTVADLYPGATPRAVLQGVRNMERILKLFASRKRKVVETVVGLAGKRAREQLIPRTPALGSEERNEALLSLYDNALERYPILAAQLTALRTGGTDLGPEFEPAFG